MPTILEVIDVNLRKSIKSSDLLERDGDLGHLRRAIKDAKKTGDVRYRCSACGEPLNVAYGPIRAPHFRHATNSPNCIWFEGRQSENWRSQKYRGRKESERHETVRSRLFNLLKNDPQVSEPKEEQWVKDDQGNRRKPDIACISSKFGLLHIEVQVSSAIFDEVVYRLEFDQRANAIPVWIFDSELKAQQFRTFSDIASQCHYNAIVFDDDAFLESLSQNELLIKVGIPHFDKFGVHENFVFKLIPLSSLRSQTKSRRLIYRCGLMRGAVAVWFCNRNLISRFRQELKSTQTVEDQSYDLVIWKALLEATSSAEISVGNDGRRRMKYIFMVCESARRKSLNAVGHSSSTLWALDMALERYPTAARAIYRIIQRYWPAFLIDYQKRDGVRKLTKLAKDEPDRSLNRLLRVLYPLAAGDLPLS